MATAKTLTATDPKSVANALRDHLADTLRHVYLKPYNWMRSHDTVYWLTRHHVPTAHYLAKGMVMPLASSDAPDAPGGILVGFYLEKGYEDFSAAPEPKLFMDDSWDWHSAKSEPSRLDDAAREMCERGGDVHVLLQSSIGTLRFIYADQMECTSVQDASDLAYASAATSLEALLAVLGRTPGVERAYVDLIVGHWFPSGVDMGLTAAQLEKQSLRPWSRWIWPDSAP